MTISSLRNAPAENVLTAHRPGRSLAAAVQARQRPLIEARKLLIDSLRSKPTSEERFAEIFATRAPNQFTDTSPESVPERAAWALVNTYLLGSAAGAPISDSLRTAEQWFLGSRAGDLPSLAECVDPSTDRACAMLLSVVTIDPEFRGFLPYVLEPFDFAHRLNAKRCAQFGERRKRKRTSGTFYTPGDVANTVVRHAVDAVSRGGRAVDPACGTGVFLLALLRELRNVGDPRTPLEIVSSSLFGMDVSDLAVESCAFVLAHECLDDAQQLDPWAVWQTIRLNLWAFDTTAVRLANVCADSTERERRRRVLLETSSVPQGTVGRNEQVPSLWQASSSQSLWDVFPEAAPGFEAIVTNPPYVRTSSERGNLYIRFVGQALRMAHPERSFIGAVLPLSIAFASDDETKHLRLALTGDSGVCRFAFFDREPHGLFGEEVKTRSAILLRNTQSGPGPAKVQTTALLRLTSRTRAALLESLPALDLGQQDIRAGVPKLGSSIEFEAYKRLAAKRFGQPALKFFSIPFESCFAEHSDRSLYVGPVAYNFINVARQLALSTLPQGEPTRSSFLRCELTDPATADSVFAVFSSRVSYWLWNVRGDGFHVSKRFVDTVSQLWGQLSFDTRTQLAQKGKELWEAVLETPIVSRNAGAWSVAFTPLSHQQLLTEIDRIVVLNLELPGSFVDFIERATVERIVVNSAEKKRKQLVG